MYKLKAMTALGGTKPRVDVFAGVKISENPDRALVSVSARQGHETVCRERARAFLGVDLPAPARAASSEGFGVLWIGPDAWMVEADHTRHELLASEIKTAVADAGSVVEQTDGWCRFEVEGSKVCDLFERLCNVDVQAMLGDAVVRTSIHHVGCYLWCREAGAAFTVMGPRSSAASLHHALIESAGVVSLD
ncbi:sarcosine oxidase subunit gamma [Shimia abyssi]|uniref:sarcosine oxidase subunit gamma n=1 Tax=Shimia abyssi TaxID=1662395 RepID=UPI001FAF0C89|nr:sarcosine oxidase, gamma subunit [Shimia abyssi]